MVRFWVRNELFEFGILPKEVVDPLPSFDSLLKLSKKIYQKQQSKLVLPYIRLIKIDLQVSYF